LRERDQNCEGVHHKPCCVTSGSGNVSRVEEMVQRILGGYLKVFAGFFMKRDFDPGGHSYSHWRHNQAFHIKRIDF